MPITKITIENFKGVGERIEIPLRPITLLFGANSAGKSTILQALLYLRELLERENVDADRLMASGASVDLGGFRQFVHGHDLSRTLRVGVEISVDADGLPGYSWRFGAEEEDDGSEGYQFLSEVRTAAIELFVDWSHETGSPWITRYEVHLNGKRVGAISADPAQMAEITWFDCEHEVFRFDVGDEDGFWEDACTAMAFVIEGLDLSGGEGPDRRIPLRSKLLPRWSRPFPLTAAGDGRAGSEREELTHGIALTRDVLSQIFVGTGELVLGELQRIRHIGSFRDIPERHFNVRRSPEANRWANGAAAWDLLFGGDHLWFDSSSFDALGLGYRVEVQSYYEIPFESAIGSFLRAFGTGSDPDLIALDEARVGREAEGLEECRRVRLVEMARDVEVDPCDVGVGVSQVLPVVVGAMAPGYSVLSVEQPELHIHPAVQCALADLLAKAVIGSDERCLLLETHSEHLMLRWLRRIREVHEEELPPGAPAVRPEHIAVLYVETVDGGQRITELPITEDGDFARKWPKGFFEERAEELF